MTGQAAQWRCHLPNLLIEIVENNPTAWALRMPIILTREIFISLAEHAAKLDDPELNVLMLRLSLYDVPPDQVSDAIREQRERIPNK